MGCLQMPLPVFFLGLKVLELGGVLIYIYHVLTSCLEFQLFPSCSPSPIISSSLHFMESPLLFLTSMLTPQELSREAPRPWAFSHYCSPLG